MANRKLLVKDYAARQIARLEQQRTESGGRAALARLRHGVGHIPGELPQLWGDFLSGLPEEMYSKSGKPTYEEWAIYIALTLFALHQQGKTASMAAQGVSLGKAAAKLAANEEGQERIWPRLNLVALSDDMPEMAYRLRQLITLLRASDIGLDYGMLAEDLYEYQFAEAVGRVRLRWGQDFFHRADGGSENGNEEDKNDE